MRCVSPLQCCFTDDFFPQSSVLLQAWQTRFLPFTSRVCFGNSFSLSWTLILFLKVCACFLPASLRLVPTTFPCSSSSSSSSSSPSSPSSTCVFLLSLFVYSHDSRLVDVRRSSGCCWVLAAAASTCLWRVVFGLPGAVGA